MSEKLNRVEFVVQKYRLGEMTFIEAEENSKKLGNGKLLADETLQEFIRADPSGNNKYLDWMIFMAGGGQDAMEKSMTLWNGEGKDDINSLRNQCRQDFIEEQTKGFTESGVYNKPVTKAEAEAAWDRWETRAKFEFLMGDQDVAIEDGYGFFRHWPGRDGAYQKIVNAVKLWHMAQPKLLAQNQRYRQMKNIMEAGGPKNSGEKKFLEVNHALKGEVALDIYAGWKPKEYSQTAAVYKTLNELLHVLADVRRMQILRDVLYEVIYESDHLLAVCPLTVGASIKFGIGKWCVCNKTDFDRSFDPRQASNNHWKTYCGRGPLVFMCWKVPMPEYLHKIALHIMTNALRSIGAPWKEGITWIDCKNDPAATNSGAVIERILQEAGGGASRRLTRIGTVADVAAPAEHHSAADEAYFKWGGRRAGPAWKDPETGHNVAQTLEDCLRTVMVWAKTFDTKRVVLDYLTDTTGAVDSIDE